MNFEIKVVVKKNREYEVVHVEDEKIIGYELQEGDIVVDLSNYNDFLKSKWNGLEWIEGATQDELDELNNKSRIPSKTEILEQELANTNTMILELTELILGGM